MGHKLKMNRANLASCARQPLRDSLCKRNAPIVPVSVETILSKRTLSGDAPSSLYVRLAAINKTWDGHLF